MKKKNIINKLIVAPLVMGFMSCTGNYMDINSNPYQPGDLTPDDYALGSAMSNLASTVISSDVNTAQFTDCLLGGPLGGYFFNDQKRCFSSQNNAVNTHFFQK